MKNGKKTGKNKGFTLIELLVVIAIIALLVSILMPALNTARQQAKALVCMTNNKSLRRALSIYFANNDDKLLPYYDSVIPGQGNLWINSIRESVGTVDDNRFCPNAPRENRLPNDTYGLGTAKKPWRWNGFAGVQLGDYAINGWLYGPDDPWAKPYRDIDFKTYADVSQPASVPVFADSIWVDTWPRDVDNPDLIANSPNVLENGYMQAGINQDMGRIWIDRHHLRITVSFFDGHAEIVPLSKLWTLSWHKKFKVRDDVEVIE